ncbi:FAD/NAD-P-binding domain-containing protein [Desarmillaria tabescens]|uniref:FAD/NAD-P-binding domain-containing protein n=1 Tax=Armillaria tabescens TaxID=1929756 RepID=A0AA39K6F2_ARMTA|nr:FAD/NAD-P-binding domain-containing protein [Desarmillaria tabescens]KAK0454074.1 FAD/NAD-P-binding domain-containing protein [Desarmillaria tabescens]
MSTSACASDIASNWIDDFSKALASGETCNVLSCILPDGWLRDILVFTWANRSLQGHEKISSYLNSDGNNRVVSAKISNVALETKEFLTPEYASATGSVASGFTFSTSVGTGCGYVHLFPDAQGVWKALSVLMMLDELYGHPEDGPELGVYGEHTLAWEDVHKKRRESVEANPHVLIIGAGQTGLTIAARFRQMNLPTLVIESNPHVGDNWRARYPTLTLHTPRTHFQFLYHQYPTNWPIYASRNKVANWLEHYAINQDMHVWTNSRPTGVPTYDPETKKWTIVINHQGVPTTLHPTHIVCASGILGAPRIPAIEDRDVFKGTVLHAEKYGGGKSYKGKRVIVVGAGNTSADICQDLVTQGAESVTMVQRSSTCVVAKHPGFTNGLLNLWPEGVPHEISDLKFLSIPLPLRMKMASARAGELAEAEREMHDGLRKAGLDVNMGQDGSGQFPMVFQRLGGYWIDVGCAELIISGSVKVKQGVELQRYLSDGVVFTDGSKLDADVVIYATGYHNIRDSLKNVFGGVITERVGQIWGLDEEGELNGCFKPSGHPGLWFGGGDISLCRIFSKRMALEVKAIQLGLVNQ